MITGRLSNDKKTYIIPNKNNRPGETTRYTITGTYGKDQKYKNNKADQIHATII